MQSVGFFKDSATGSLVHVAMAHCGTLHVAAVAKTNIEEFELWVAFGKTKEQRRVRGTSS